jgi:protein-tyrosine phosphatase
MTLARYSRHLDQMLLEGYTRVMIDRNARLFGGIFRRLADDDGLPAVIHCTAGKDRTGIASALLLAALGGPEATIIADYSLTNRDYAHIYELVKAQMAPLTRFGLTADDLHPLMLANPETLRAALRYLHQHYGDVETYLRERAGVDEATLARLRNTLLE